MKPLSLVPVLAASAFVAFVSSFMLLPRSFVSSKDDRGIVLFWTDNVGMVPYATHITPHIALHPSPGSEHLLQSALRAHGVVPLEAAPGNALSRLSDRQILEKWNGIVQPGYIGLGFDEFGGWNHQQNARFGRLLREFRKNHPYVYIAVWNAGHLDPALARAYRTAANLVIMEAYGHWGLRLILRLTYRIMQVRYFGLVHKTIYGIGIDDAASAQTLASWGRWANSPADLRRQLAWIAAFAPDMPGIGFFAPYASDRMLKIADSLAHRYFQNR